MDLPRNKRHAGGAKDEREDPREKKSAWGAEIPGCVHQPQLELTPSEGRVIMTLNALTLTPTPETEFNCNTG